MPRTDTAIPLLLAFLAFCLGVALALTFCGQVHGQQIPQRRAARTECYGIWSEVEDAAEIDLNSCVIDTNAAARISEIDAANKWLADHGGASWWF